MSAPSETPLVSVIVPVRNGAPTLRLMLDGLLRQSYRNIEVLISDNASTDSTEGICRVAMASDPRIRYVRQTNPITATDNFKYWLTDALGEYVLFAAHDDLRNRTYIESLVAAFRNRPGLVCAMPRVFNFNKYTSSPFQVFDPIAVPPAECTNPGSPALQRWKAVVFNGIPSYGLLRSDVVRSYPWFDIDFGPDIPFAIYLTMSGELDVCPDAFFYYWTPVKNKTAEERAFDNSLRRLKPFREARLAWTCGLAASAAKKKRGVVFPALLGFFAAYSYRQWHSFKGFAYPYTPGPLRVLWRQVKVHLRLPLN